MANVKRCIQTLERFGPGGPVPWSIRERKCSRDSAPDSAYCWQHPRRKKRKKR